MKVETARDLFQPVTITLETQDEIDEMFAVFNFSPILSALDQFKGISHPLFEALCKSRSSDYTRFWKVLDSNLERKK